MKPAPARTRKHTDLNTYPHPRQPARKHPGGRPPLKPEDRLSERVLVRLRMADVAALDEAMPELDRGHKVRMALREWLEGLKA